MYRGKNLYVMLTEYILCTVYSEKMMHALIYHVITNTGGVIEIWGSIKNFNWTLPDV